MKMIVHQAIGMHLPIGLATGLSQGFQEESPVRIVTEDGLPPVAAIQEVIDRPFVFHSGFTCHARRDTAPALPHLSILRTDTFLIEPRGYVFNTEAVVGDAVIKGRFLGKLIAERSLTIFSSAEIKGSFTSGRLIIPAANHFRWKETIHVGSAEIAGELAANLHATGAIVLKSTARLFGDIEAGNLVVEGGAVVVGHAQIGPKRR